MGIFHNPKDEDRLCGVLRAFVEEWGPDNVSVHVPKTWIDKNYHVWDCAVKLFYDTVNSVSIIVKRENLDLVKFEIELAEPTVM
jgi:hypothetical protein